MNKYILVVCLSVVLTSCASTKPPYVQYEPSDASIAEGSQLHLKYTGPATAPYFGLVNYDSLKVESGNMMYPGGHPAVFIVSILAHAATVESIKNSKESELQVEANKVLIPYKRSIEKINYKDLMVETVKLLPSPNNGLSIHDFENMEDVLANDQWVLESKPVYYMLQDQGALVLKNSIVIYSKSESPNIKYQNVIEVISVPFQGDNPQEYWTKNEGEILLDTSINLLADSIQLAINDAAKKHTDKNGMQQTFHFYQEGKKTYERGRLVTVEHDRLTIRTLRGWLKSVPIIANSADDLEQQISNHQYASIQRGIGVIYQ